MKISFDRYREFVNYWNDIKEIFKDLWMWVICYKTVNGYEKLDISFLDIIITPFKILWLIFIMAIMIIIIPFALLDGIKIIKTNKI